MGLSEKPPQIIEGGIALRAPLKPIYTVIPMDQKGKENEEHQEHEEEEFSTSTTPTGEEAKLPTTFNCPPAPRKRKPTLKCNYLRGGGSRGGAREFFTPPDLETVFIRHVVERAN
ncbi:hypothetical protein PIB30_030502 [Stylosanthes scabra]|uniref:Cyclin-dependent protein kinase inhibitor SMR6 n=1 Tax=Stylosanthes scabra TaxID=79078 RepID=A0ABU6XBQ9_9FABA|nr:hypothetical protein [Stylosanthes scabra]